MNPAWISAITSIVTAMGSLAAFGTAVWAARAAWKQVAHNKEQKKLEQASKVAAWLTVEKDPEIETFEVHLRLVNASNLPVYDLLIHSPYTDEEAGILDIAEPTSQAVSIPLDFVKWKAEREIKNDIKEAEEELDPEEYDLVQPAAAYQLQATIILRCGVAIRFRDNQNQIWRRQTDGTLHPAQLDSNGKVRDDPMTRIRFSLERSTSA